MTHFENLSFCSGGSGLIFCCANLILDSENDKNKFFDEKQKKISKKYM